MQETKTAEQRQQIEEPGRRGHMRARRRPPRAMMLMMPLMMIGHLCWQTELWRSMKRIERKLNDLEERGVAGHAAGGGV